MFAGRRRRSSTTIRAMQLFHELKQQFPTIPDHIVTSCIAAHSQDKATTIKEILEAQTQDPMGRSSSHAETLTTLNTHQNHPHHDNHRATSQRNRFEMNESGGDDGNSTKSDPAAGGVTYSKKLDAVNVVLSGGSNKPSRPDRLDFKPDDFKGFTKLEDSLGRLQLSEKCRDVHKLLNSDKVSDKPPRSPLNSKRFVAKTNSPTKLNELGTIQRSPLASPCVDNSRLTSDGFPARKETASRPTQTTDTLMAGQNPSVNLSLNVNCSMDVVRSPTANRRTSILQVTPQQPWLFHQDASSPSSSSSSSSPRSYTSVNLTLRPPSVQPQAPIDITSQNSSLTYSTSSFDSQKGLQSRLQITVGPGGNSVSSMRSRPRSSYHPQDDLVAIPARTGSLSSLAVTNSEPPVILKQEARIERLRIELKSEKANLVVMQQEITELEKSAVRAIEDKVDAEIDKQLRKEIKHLQYQCSQLATEVDKVIVDNTNEDFYHNIYTGQRGQLSLLDNATRIRINRDRITSYHRNQASSINERLKWDCPMCTFLNHPDLDKCEQCDMPRIFHGKTPPPPYCSYPILRHAPPPPPSPHQSAVHNLQNHSTNQPVGFVLADTINHQVNRQLSAPLIVQPPSGATRSSSLPQFHGRNERI